jgi:hypothetical protein
MVPNLDTEAASNASSSPRRPNFWASNTGDRDQDEDLVYIEDAAAKLLSALTRASQITTQLPFIAVVFRSLLKERFSVAAEPEIHHRLVMLFVVRWWAHKYLHNLISDVLTHSRCSSLSNPSSHTHQQRKVLEDTFFNHEDAHLLSALHSVVYAAIVKVTDPSGPRSEFPSPLHTAARQAVETLCHLSDSFHVSHDSRQVTESVMFGGLVLGRNECSILLQQLSSKSSADTGNTNSLAATFFLAKQADDKVHVSRARIAPSKDEQPVRGRGPMHNSNGQAGISPSNPKAIASFKSSVPVLSAFSASMTNGASRMFSSWGSPVGSPADHTLSPTSGAGFFDVMRTASDRQDTPSQIAPVLAAEMRKGILLLAQDSAWPTLKVSVESLLSSAARFRTQSRWSDAATLEWCSEQLSALPASVRIQYTSRLLAELACNLYSNERTVRAASERSQTLAIEVLDRFRVLQGKAQFLLSCLHEDRSRIFYAAVTRLGDAVRACWRLGVSQSTQDTVETWMKDAGVQNLFIDESDAGLVYALEGGFASIAGSASLFFDHPM